MTSISYDDIRDVLGTSASETPNEDLTPEKSMAEGIVTDELEPYTTNQGALDDVAALVAAAFYRNEGIVGQLSQGSQQVSYKDGAMGYWRQALIRDPTGRLKDLDSGGDFWSVTL